MEMDQEIVAAVEDVLQEILGIVGETVRLSVDERSDGDISIDIQGDITVFNEKDQKTLQSLSYLLEIFVKRRFDRNVRIHLDVNGYRWRREEELVKMVLELADRIKTERVRIRLNPMESYERKTIHVALSHVDGVRTYSQGSGAGRRVIIEPDL